MTKTARTDRVRAALNIVGRNYHCCKAMDVWDKLIAPAVDDTPGIVSAYFDWIITLGRVSAQEALVSRDALLAILCPPRVAPVRLPHRIQMDFRGRSPVEQSMNVVHTQGMRRAA